MMRRCGHSSARSRRSVISADSWFIWLCTLPITRSSSASASFGQVHRAILQNVALDAAEDANAQPGAIDLAHAPRELHHALFIEPVGHGERFGVVGDGDVLVAVLARRLGHFLERGAAIGLGGVHVQVAADVARAPPVPAAAPVRRLRSRRCSRAAPAESTAGRAPGRCPPRSRRPPEPRRPRGTGRTRSASGPSSRRACGSRRCDLCCR